MHFEYCGTLQNLPNTAETLRDLGTFQTYLQNRLEPSGTFQSSGDCESLKTRQKLKVSKSPEPSGTFRTSEPLKPS